MPNPSNIREKCQAIRLLLTDVDGVLTDGKLIYGSDGVETKQFHVRDGLAVKLWKNCGYALGLITARQSTTVQRRAEELGIDLVLQSRPHKLEAVREVAAVQQLELSEIAYIGDDLHDLSAVDQVGLGITVADGVDEVKAVADHVAIRPGGAGALREIVEFILKSKNEWDRAIESFSGK